MSVCVLLQDDRVWCFLLDEHAYIIYSSLNRSRYSYAFSSDPIEKRDSFVGRWFGHVNRITERAMALLYKNHFYTESVNALTISNLADLFLFVAGPPMSIIRQCAKTTRLSYPRQTC